MMPCHTYQLHQIERPKSRAEILRADEQLGRMADSVTVLLERMFRPIAARALPVRDCRQPVTAQRHPARG